MVLEQETMVTMPDLFRHLILSFIFVLRQKKYVILSRQDQYTLPLLKLGSGVGYLPARNR